MASRSLVSSVTRGSRSRIHALGSGHPGLVGSQPATSAASTPACAARREAHRAPARCEPRTRDRPSPARRASTAMCSPGTAARTSNPPSADSNVTRGARNEHRCSSSRSTRRSLSSRPRPRSPSANHAMRSSGNLAKVAPSRSSTRSSSVATRMPSRSRISRMPSRVIVVAVNTAPSPSVPIAVSLASRARRRTIRFRAAGGEGSPRACPCMRAGLAARALSTPTPGEGIDPATPGEAPAMRVTPRGAT